MRENKRFAVVPAGRRSGKTELAKRRLVIGLPEKKSWTDPRYFAAAPTRDQAKRIFWKDLLELIPEGWVSRVYSTDLCVVTRFKSELWVVGLDKPQRIEGTPWDGGVLDEYANMKPGAWTENIRPALSDRQGWCWFVGVPEGLNHYRDLADYAGSGKDPEWGVYSWSSSDILPPEELAAAKRVLDAKTFRQEYEGSFEGASGRAYYAYDPKKHEDASLMVNEKLPINLCCDFNESAGVLTKKKEIQMLRGGALRVKFDLMSDNTAKLAYGQVYKNGVAAGTLQSTNSTTYVTFTEDLAGWVPGDLVQLYLKIETPAFIASVSNFRICVSHGVVNID